MAISQHLMTKSNSIEGVQQWTYRAIANALEIIPKTLSQNCGAKVVKILTELRAKHASDPEKNSTFGIDGNEGKIVDMKTLGIWEPVSVKSQTLKSAIESACLLLRVDDILSGISKKKEQKQQQPAQPQPGDMDDAQE